MSRFHAPSLRKAHKRSRTCWNCGETDHELFDCPHRRDQAQIALSRATFNTYKDAVPEYAMAHLWMYTFDEAERARRLDLVDRFRPGQISSTLADAIFAIGEDMSPDEIERIGYEKRRRRYPWLTWMMKWGYPPGWIAGKGEPTGLSCLHEFLLTLLRSHGSTAYETGEHAA